MPYYLIFTESYEKIERRFLKRHPDLLDRYHKTLAVLEQEPFHPSLRLHALEGRLAGLHAVSINLQSRITLQAGLCGGPWPACRIQSILDRHLSTQAAG